MVLPDWSNSLIGRLLLASLLLVPTFLGFSGYALYEAFRQNSLIAKQQQLQLQIKILLGATEIEGGKAWLPEVLQEPRFGQLQSGLFGFVSDREGRLLWQSPSSRSIDVGRALLVPPKWRAGRAHFVALDNAGQAVFVYQYPVIWEQDIDTDLQLTFSVVEDQTDTLMALQAFEGQIWLGLGAAAIALIVAQLLILRWGTKPLRQLTVDLKNIENGDIERLEGQYPLELRALSNNLNLLIEFEHRQRERYRTTLADLAHSLKTPLAVIKGELDKPVENQGELPATVKSQVQRMEEIVSHQLQRAVIGRSHSLRQAIPVKENVEKLVAALKKVYLDKSVELGVDIEENCAFKGDVRDLMEVLGNVLDNAFKACDNTVLITGRQAFETLELRIADDGSGVPHALREQILKRGERLDSSSHGQGIGLAVVVDIIDSYDGKLRIERADLGGALFVISFPG